MQFFPLYLQLTSSCPIWLLAPLGMPTLTHPTLPSSASLLANLSLSFTHPLHSSHPFAGFLRIEWHNCTSITNAMNYNIPSVYLFFRCKCVCICHALARTGLSLWWIFSKSSEWTLNGTRTEKNSCSVGNWIFCAWFGAFAIFARVVALAFCCAEYFCVTHHSDGLNANENKKHFKLKKTARRMLNEAQEWHSVFVCVLWVCWVNETTKYRFAKSLDLKDISSI